jgi:hypothetical protein
MSAKREVPQPKPERTPDRTTDRPKRAIGRPKLPPYSPPDLDRDGIYWIETDALIDRPT